MFLRELIPRARWAWTIGALVVAFQPTFNFIAAGVQADNGRTEALDHVNYGARVGVEELCVGGFDGIWDGFGVGFVKHWI